jgi:hypothetical protein
MVTLRFQIIIKLIDQSYNLKVRILTIEYK